MLENKKFHFNWLYLVFAVLACTCIYFLFANNGTSGEQISLGDAYQKLNDNQITDVYAYDTTVKLRVVNSEIEDQAFPNNADFYFTTTSEEISAFINEVRVKIEGGQQINYQYPPLGMSIWSILTPVLYIGFGLIIIFLVFRMLGNSNKGAMNFGKSKARAVNNVKVRFTDIAGAEEEKEELAEIVEFLKNPQKFTAMGARIPKGVLLVGNPGTGKTLLARAVAGESNVPFLSVSGSDFVEMFVGVGASRVRDLFDSAKKNMPCIVFIDEIDAVGRQRGAGLGGGNDEREQTLNQLLVEMDGFEANEGIIVLAATNRSDVLDPALLRPGRFDRQIYVHTPDVRGREGIIRIHSRKKPIDNEVDFQTLARITSGFTGADIENMLNEAAILAARAGRPKILMVDLTEGINKVLMGPQKKSLLVTENDRRITAIHESGHAIVGKSLKNCEEIQEVSIIPRGHAAGYTMHRPDNDDTHMTFNHLNDEIAMMMGGRVAEEIVLKDITTGASSDIQRATELARKMVTEWGMSKKLGFVSFGSSNQVFIGRDYQTKNDFSEATASNIDSEIMNVLQDNYLRVKKILTEKRKLIEEMADLLLEKETIYKDEVNMLMDGKSKDEVVKHMDELEEKRKKKEAEGRLATEYYKKQRDAEERLAKAESYLAKGIISQKDYQLILDEYNRVTKELENLNTVDTSTQSKVSVPKKTKQSKDPVLTDIADKKGKQALAVEEDSKKTIKDLSVAKTKTKTKSVENSDESSKVKLDESKNKDGGKK